VVVDLGGFDGLAADGAIHRHGWRMLKRFVERALGSFAGELKWFRSTDAVGKCYVSDKIRRDEHHHYHCWGRKDLPSNVPNPTLMSVPACQAKVINCFNHDLAIRIQPLAVLIMFRSLLIRDVHHFTIGQ
jgi:hypothetical protein